MHAQVEDLLRASFEKIRQKSRDEAAAEHLRNMRTLKPEQIVTIAAQARHDLVGEDDKVWEDANYLQPKASIIPDILLRSGLQVTPELRERSRRMAKSSRHNHIADFKAKMALAAIKGEKTFAELSQQFDVHANQIMTWKAQLLEGAAGIFGPEGKAAAEPAAAPADIKTLHAKIGEPTLVNDFWKARQANRDCWSRDTP